MYIARNKDGGLYLYDFKPIRNSWNLVNSDKWISLNNNFKQIDSNLFPSVTWYSEPIEVELTIKQ